MTLSNRPHCPSYRRCVVIGVGILLVFLVGSTSAFAEVRPTPAQTYVANGSVSSVAPTPQAIYIAGNFSQIGPRTGPGVGIHPGTGENLNLPMIYHEDSGRGQTVADVIPDGSGGFFVAGRFTRVGSFERLNLVHLLPDGTVDPAFAPQPNGRVLTLARAGSTLYIGGEFTQVGGVERSAIAALDTTTGAVSAWNPAAVSALPCCAPSVEAIAVAGSAVYVGGRFGIIGGKQRLNLAQLDATTGLATDFRADVALGTSSFVRVLALAVSGSTLYIGGRFSTVRQQTRTGLAAVDAGTGTLKPWNPGPSGPVNSFALAGPRLYVGGAFGVEGRAYLVAFRSDTGQLIDSWAPKLRSPGFQAPSTSVSDLQVSGNTVYVGGQFQEVNDSPRNNLAAVDTSTGAERDWNPNPADEVFAVARTGPIVYAGGRFTSIGGVERNNLAALDPRTGAPTPWDPNTIRSVSEVDVAGATVFVAGPFTRIGNQRVEDFAALDASTGSVVWEPSIDGSVSAVAVDGPTVYIGGSFQEVDDQFRNRLAAFDIATHQLLPWSPIANGTVTALAPSGSTLYIGGSFTTVEHRNRSHIASLDPITGEVTDWRPQADGLVGTIEPAGSTIYVGGAFTRIGGESRKAIAALDPTTGDATAFDPDPRPESFSVGMSDIAVDGSTVYAAGTFGRIGGAPRTNLAALDATTGSATSWAPRATGHSFFDLAIADDGSLWVGGFFDSIGTVPQSGFARFPVVP